MIMFTNLSPGISLHVQFKVNNDWSDDLQKVRISSTGKAY
jgi:hypothetical protein